MADRAPLLLALSAMLILPLAGIALIWAIARAPDDHTGRILVMFDDQPGDTVAYTRIAASGARPIRVIGSLDGWIAEADTTRAVAILRQQYGASHVFRDIGLGRALAGCLGLVSGPVRGKGIIP
jgi:hypothetical protein